MAENYETRGVVLPAHMRSRVAEMAALRGDRDLASDLELTRQTLARAVAGFSVSRGTAAQIREWLRENDRTAA